MMFLEYYKRIVLCLCLLLSGASVLYAQEAEQNSRESGVKYYDGLLFHLYLSLGQGTFSGYAEHLPSNIPLNDPEDDAVKSTLLRNGFDVGYAYSPHWVPYWGMTHTYYTNVQSPDQIEGYDTAFSEFSMELGLYYYFLQNWYLLFALQGNEWRLTYTADNDSGPPEFSLLSTYDGPGIKLGFGKEWWLGEHSTLGVGLVYRDAVVDSSDFGGIPDGKYNYYGFVLSFGYDPDRL